MQLACIVPLVVALKFMNKVGFIWVSIRENLNVSCKKYVRRPACASPQYDQHLCYLLSGKYNSQGLHRLEKYLNVQDCLEKSLKIKFTLKST